MYYGMNYCAVGMIFLFVISVTDRDTKQLAVTKLTTGHTIRSELVVYFMFKSCSVIGTSMSSLKLDADIQ